MNKFKVNDIVKFTKDSKAIESYPQDFIVVRAYQSKDTYKYDISTTDEAITIIATLESVLEGK